MKPADFNRLISSEPPKRPEKTKRMVNCVLETTKLQESVYYERLDRVGKGQRLTRSLKMIKAITKKRKNNISNSANLTSLKTAFTARVSIDSFPALPPALSFILVLIQEKRKT